MHFIQTDPAPAGPVWSFDGNVTAPTFGPSVKITYNGSDADQRREGDRRAPSRCCHYFIQGGVLKFCSDSSHAFSGREVPLPSLPEGLRDSP